MLVCLYRNALLFNISYLVTPKIWLKSFLVICTQDNDYLISRRIRALYCDGITVCLCCWENSARNQISKWNWPKMPFRLIKSNNIYSLVYWLMWPPHLQTTEFRTIFAYSNWIISVMVFSNVQFSIFVHSVSQSISAAYNQNEARTLTKIHFNI